MAALPDQLQDPATSSKPIHTPPSSLDQSPSKRARLDSNSALGGSQSQEGYRATAFQQPQLQPLPLPLLLLTLAHSLHASALSLHPVLARRPASANSLQRYANAWSSYTRLTAGAVALLRKCVEVAKEGGEGSGSGRVEVRARALLAEVALEMGGQGMVNEVEKTLSKAIVAAEKHPSFNLLKPYLTLLSTRATLNSSSTSTTSLKYARTTLRRLLSTPPFSSPSAPSADLPHPAWTYTLHLTLASLPSTPYAEALASWREVEKIAKGRGDEAMRLVSLVGQARIALSEGEWRVVESCLMECARTMGWLEDSAETPAPATGTTSTTESLPAPLQIQLLLIFALFHAHMGEVKMAKDKLKKAHGLLDADVGAAAGSVGGTKEEIEERKKGEKEGWCVIPIHPPRSANPSSPSTTTPNLATNAPPLPTPTTVTLRIPSRAIVYNFAFLASVAVHRDPFGTRPRSTLFANEGLKMLDAKLVGIEHLPPSTTPASIHTTLRSLARLKIHLLLFTAELSIMRSTWEKAEEQLGMAVATARAYSRAGSGEPIAGAGGEDLWEVFRGRITLDWGLLAQARGEDQVAEECFETVLMEEPAASEPGGAPRMQRKKSSGGAAQEKEDELGEEKINLVALAKVSLLILKIGQGTRVRLSTSSSTSAPSSSAPSSSSSADARLTALSRSLVALTADIPTSPPSLQLLTEFIQALTKGEITKAKQHLSVALALANSSGQNHAKAVLLGLLGNLFVWTRNDQAQKMLLASLHIARNMGARPDSRTKEEQEQDKQLGRTGANEVGNARLGLWVGERLGEAYKRDDPSKALKQESLNEAHREVLDKEVKGGAAKARGG